MIAVPVDPAALVAVRRAGPADGVRCIPRAASLVVPADVPVLAGRVPDLVSALAVLAGHVPAAEWVQALYRLPVMRRVRSAPEQASVVAAIRVSIRRPKKAR